MLRGFNYDVFEAADGRAGLRALQDHDGPIDLLVTDVVMPAMNGPELAARAAAVRPGLRVLYMSGYTDGAIREEAGLTPGSHFIQKPYTGEQLHEKVRQVLAAPATLAPPPRASYGKSPVKIS